MVRHIRSTCIRSLVVLPMLANLYCGPVPAEQPKVEGTPAPKTSTPSQTGSPISVDTALPSYTKVEGVTGNLNSIGSDTLNNVMTLWAEEFKKLYPKVVIGVEGKGSTTAPPALINGTAQLGPMSRKMKSEEIDAVEKKYGVGPTAIGVSLDSLAVFVSKDNPIKELTLPQVDAIFSKNRAGKYPKDIITWGDAGLTGEWKDRPISIYGRNAASGTYAYFKEHALFKGDFKDVVKEAPGSASVVMSVTADKAGIGYSGIGYRTSGVKTVPLSVKEGAQSFDATYENVLSGKYPLSRMLYVYIIKKPNEPLSPLVHEFLRFVLSKQGQEVVVKDGYLPLPANVAEKQAALLTK
jgi:phosphate transport system substrate-binding protein